MEMPRLPRRYLVREVRRNQAYPRDDAESLLFVRPDLPLSRNVRLLAMPLRADELLR